ncbi:transketolase family protein [Methanofollis fontis]|uniref:Transketolase n=1 Tax=Methanofollis fontis TaxID=2052832 RepID=A0A483CNU5_9EURY|nr:transketolase C-terminal domain-containing protein [Methanofollis fontis]TAJ43697.1 transketolase [Methanofollis fontis]
MLDISSKNVRTWSKLGSRGTLGSALLDLASSKEDLVVLSADLGNTSGLGRFMNVHPNKFYNLGIAESNMVGVAAGMAKEGNCVFATTFSNFLAMRSYEQIRLNMGYMQFPIILVGVGSGFEMGMFGNTHYGIEDMALMRAVPNMTLLSPADGAEIIKTVNAAVEYARPVYIRLTGGMNLPIVYKENYEFEIGRAVTLREGDDMTIIATGTMVYESLCAAEYLAEHDIEAEVVDMHTIKPLDTSVIDRAVSKKLIITVEEHSVVGGLGGAVAEYKTTLHSAPPQLFIGVPDTFGKAGEYKWMLEHYGLTAKGIAEKIFDMYVV